MELIVDEEFSQLLPAMTDEEYNGLKNSICIEGYDEAFPIIVWEGHNIIVDGRARYEISRDYMINYTTVSKKFSSRYEVSKFILDNQLNRKNLNGKTREYLVGRLARLSDNTPGLQIPALTYPQKWLLVVKHSIVKARDDINTLCKQAHTIAVKVSENAEHMTLEEIQAEIEVFKGLWDKVEKLNTVIEQSFIQWEKILDLMYSDLEEAEEEVKEEQVVIQKTVTHKETHKEVTVQSDLKTQMQIMKEAKKRKADKKNKQAKKARRA